MKGFFYLFLCLNMISQAHAQGIPLNYSQAPATDLMYLGKAISSTEAWTLSTQGVKLAELNPNEDQDIWANTFPTDSSYDVEPLPYQEINFKSFVLSQTGKLRFLGKLLNGETLNFVTSKNVHTQIIRRNLLIKLGYTVPYLAYVPKIRINFSSRIDRELFTKELTEKTLGEPKRWIEEEGEDFLVINDLVAQKTGNAIIDLSNGYLPSDIIRGKRTLNSLQVVYALTDFGESANLFSWSPGHIFNDHLFLPYEFDSEFSPTMDDAQWMSQRISQLSRIEWKRIIDKSFLPEPVSEVILEKMIARRNQLLKLTKLDVKEIDYDPKISDGQDLVDGEIIQDNFPGYAARFSYGDPDSPLNLKELLYYGGIKTISALLDAAVSKFNSLPFLSNDKYLSYHIQKKANESFLNEVFDYMKTGVYKPSPFGVYSVPMVNGSLIVTRDVVAGNYLGTDNLFQLVDSVGVSTFAGVYLGVQGIEGITGNLPVSAQGSAGVSYNRIYSHVKPLQSMKGAFKYPFLNILVPLAKLRVGHKLRPLLSVDDEELAEPEIKEMVEKIISVFNSKMSQGESFIITDTIGAGLNAGAGMGFMKIMTAQIGVSGNQVVTSRLHILKASDQEFHIYKDFGNVTSFAVQMKASAIIPILKVKITQDKGRARINFYKVKLAKNPSNADEINKYLMLKNAFTKGTLRKLKKDMDPVKFRYKISQNISGGNLLVGQVSKINTRFNLRVLHPEGQHIDLFKRYSAFSKGLNYMSLSSDVLAGLVKIFLYPDFSLDSYDGGGNAGFTFLGKALSKTTTFESSQDFLKDEKYAPVVKVSRIWNGWSIKQKNALKILKNIRERYEYDFYPPDVLNETKKIFLYSFHVNFVFYHGAIKNALSMSDADIDQLVKDYSRQNINLPKIKVKRLKILLSKAREAKTLKRLSFYHNKFFSMAERVLTLRGIEKLSGGKENFFVYSRIEGFRSKDENGDQPLFSNSYGEYGHYMVTGPFDYLKRLLGVSEAELSVNWMLRRIY